MEASKRKNILIENDISGYIDTTSRYIKTFKTFVKIAVPKKSTLLRPVLKFVIVIGSKIGPLSTPENSKDRIIGFFME